jgi:perosamine synthetase
MPVSLFGISAPMRPITDLAKNYNVKVVEDDACAIGAKYQGLHAGALADISCFSFHPRKAITTGEGGMVSTGNELLVERIRSLRDHGASKSDLVRHLGNRSYLLPDFNEVGYNYRMTDFQGALGSIQIKRLPWILEQRSRLAKNYYEFLGKCTSIRPPIIPHDCQHGYQAYVTLFQPEPPTLQNVTRLNSMRNELMDKLEKAEIATRPGTHAVHMLGYYARKYDLKPEDFPNAYLADQLTLTLPLFAQMTELEQEYVLEHLLHAEGLL